MTASKSYAGSVTAAICRRRTGTLPPGFLAGKVSTRVSANMLERVNEEIKMRTRVVRIFPNRSAPELCGAAAYSVQARHLLDKPRQAAR